MLFSFSCLLLPVYARFITLLPPSLYGTKKVCIMVVNHVSKVSSKLDLIFTPYT